MSVVHNYCVYLNKAYLAKFLALYGSMEKYCQPYLLWVLALDKTTLESLHRLNLPNAQIVPFDMVETVALRKVKSLRTHLEYIWTCKATWILWLLKERGVEGLMYLDTDMSFFGSPSPVFEEIGNRSIAITPHRFPAHLRHFERNGLFNVGIVYVDQSPRAIDCIGRWAKQCVTWCYRRHDGNKFTEQRYLDEWPSLWDAYSIQHKGFNLAPWNQEQYTYSARDGSVYVDNDVLVLYHFHQGLKPSYNLVPFVKARIYEPYRSILDKARKTAHL